jgi:hypothetical protein
VRCGSLKIDLPGRFLPLSLLRVCGNLLASVLVQVRVGSLGPCPEPSCGAGIMRDDGGMNLMDFQDCEAPSISVEARACFSFWQLAGNFGTDMRALASNKYRCV